MLPRRYFNTQSNNDTDNIVRARDSFKTKVLDDNDVASAYVVKENIIKLEDLETRIEVLESAGSVGTGTLEEFDTYFTLSK